MNRELLDFLKMNDVKYIENLPLACISPIKIGAEATIVAYPNSENKLVNLVGFLENNKIRYKIIGRMSNVLPPDEKYNGVIVKTDRITSCGISGRILECSLGAGIPFVANLLCKAGLSGFEGLCGIPGSIGGGIACNAGAFGREISDLLLDAKVYDIEDECVVELANDDLDFAYRSSVLKNRPWLLLSARFKLSESNTLSVKRRMSAIREKRRVTQPTDMLSLGSTFKRPPGGYSAAFLIDQCGLKGYSVGGASVSEKHAGFIINRGNSTAKDYIALVEHIKKRVSEAFGVRLQREVEIL